MTACSSIDPTQFLHEQLASASPDLLRSMLTTFINTLMSAECRRGLWSRLPARGVDPAHGEARGVARDHPAVQERGLDHGRRARHRRGRVPPPPARPGPYTFVAAAALVLKVREGGRVVNVHALVATGVNGDRHREILGLQVSSAEDGADWLAFLRDLTARDLTSARLVTSDSVHYNTQRPHRALQLRPPRPKSRIPEPVHGRIRRQPVLGGLINHYEAAA